MALYAPSPLAVISHGLYNNAAAAVQTSKPGTWSLADSGDGQTWTLTVAGSWSDTAAFLLSDTDAMDGSGAAVLKGNMLCKGLVVGHNYSLQAVEVGKTLSDAADTQHAAPSITANYSAGAANMRAGTSDRVDGSVAAGAIPQTDILPASGGTCDKLYSAADEASRNTVPDLSLIPSPATGGPTAWKQLNVSRSGTLDLTALLTAYEAARNTLVTAAKVALAWTYKQFGTDYVGEYAGGGGTAPDAPLSIGATAGNGQVVVAVVQAHAGDVIQVRYKLKTSAAWVAANISHRRTGSGNVTVSGLVNESTYEFMAYTLAAGLESEWIGPATCAPTAGANKVYTTFKVNLRTALQGSATLAAACTDGLPALHVKLGRYLFSASDDEATLLTSGPLLFLRDVPYTRHPRTRESQQEEMAIALGIVQKIDQTTNQELITESNFVEGLIDELQAGIDGQAALWTAGWKLEAEIAAPEMLARDQIEHVVTLRLSAVGGV
jgi:hypothetical protein